MSIFLTSTKILIPKIFIKLIFIPKKSEKKVCFWSQETIMQILQRPNRTEGALMKCFKDSFWTIVSTNKQNNVSFVVGHPNMLHSFHISHLQRRTTTSPLFTNHYFWIGSPTKKQNCDCAI